MDPSWIASVCAADAVVKLMTALEEDLQSQAATATAAATAEGGAALQRHVDACRAAIAQARC